MTLSTCRIDKIRCI